MTFTIREQHAGGGEWSQVRALIDRAFEPAPGGPPACGGAGLLAEWVHENNQILSLVAEQDGRLVGHVLFGLLPLRTESGDVDVVSLTPLSVDSDVRREGIARALVAAGLAILADRPEPLVVLEGSPTMYSKFGFRPGSEIGIERPSELIPDAAFQVVTLPSHQPDLRGKVIYPQYFYDIGAVGP
jgi:putative acetyltransferase